MQVLHIATGLNDGGAEGVLFRLCTFPGSAEHTVISLMDDGKYGQRLRDAGIEVHVVGMPRGSVTIAGLWRLWKVLRRCRPTVVQTWMYHADLLGGVMARLAGHQSVFWGVRHSTLDPGSTKRSTVVVARACAWLSRSLPRRIICCARRAVEVHKALGYAPSKLVVIANGYDIDEFRPDWISGERWRHQMAIDPNTPLLGMVARFHPQKDHETLIKALSLLARQVKPFTCVLVGMGMTSDNTNLTCLLEEAGVSERVLLLGPRNDIPTILNAIDIHVLSSLGGEAFPNVVAEAMACGTPCVVTNVGDAFDIVGNTGWVVPPQRHDELAGAIAAALAERSDPATWKSRCRDARARIATSFSMERMVGEYERVWTRN